MCQGGGGAGPPKKAPPPPEPPPELLLAPEDAERRKGFQDRKRKRQGRSALVNSSLTIGSSAALPSLSIG